MLILASTTPTIYREVKSECNENEIVNQTWSQDLTKEKQDYSETNALRNKEM